MTRTEFLLLIFSLFLCGAMCAGCTDSDTNVVLTPTPTPSPVATTAPPAPVLIVDSLLSDVDVTFSATAGGKGTEGVLISYTIDASRIGGVMTSEGFDILITGFAYNVDAVAPGWHPQSYADVVRDNAPYPYKSNRIRLYPSNVYTDRIEPAVAPLEGRTLDTTKAWNYGLILQVVG
jgi:hypothetical protein